jgi:hypothetical protein
VTALAKLADVAFVEMTSPGGARQIVPFAAYVELPAEVLRTTHARLLSRGEVIRRRGAARRAR